MRRVGLHRISTRLPAELAGRETVSLKVSCVAGALDIVDEIQFSNHVSLVSAQSMVLRVADVTQRAHARAGIATSVR